MEHFTIRSSFAELVFCFRIMQFFNKCFSKLCDIIDFGFTKNLGSLRQRRCTYGSFLNCKGNDKSKSAWMLMHIMHFSLSLPLSPSLTYFWSLSFSAPLYSGSNETSIWPSRRVVPGRPCMCGARPPIDPAGHTLPQLLWRPVLWQTCVSRIIRECERLVPNRRRRRKLHVPACSCGLQSEGRDDEKGTECWYHHLLVQKPKRSSTTHGVYWWWWIEQQQL